MEINKDYLSHIGVLGMRWGVRKSNYPHETITTKTGKKVSIMTDSAYKRYMKDEKKWEGHIDDKINKKRQKIGLSFKKRIKDIAHNEKFKQGVKLTAAGLSIVAILKISDMAKRRANKKLAENIAKIIEENMRE